MNNPIPGIVFSLNTLRNLSQQSVKEIVNLICNAPIEIRPTRFGLFGGDYPLGDLDSASNLLIKRKNTNDAGSLVLVHGENCEYQLQWNNVDPPSFHFIGGFLLNKSFTGRKGILQNFVDLVKSLAIESAVVYGEIRSMESPDWDVPFNLRVRLPDIPNISIYGAPYVNFFSKEKIEKAPFHYKEEITQGIYWLEAIESVDQVVPEDVRMMIRSHLGDGAFMSGKKWRYKDGLHPDFDFSSLAK